MLMGFIQTVQQRPSACLTFLSSRSNYYRSIKLFFIGNSMRGKTTLLRRLQHMAEDKSVVRTAGIDIAMWTHPDPKKSGDKRKPVDFIGWDFAGQVAV